MSKKKVDPNYIAAVEKAISEKYGKDTVQDFRNSWEAERETEYLQQLKGLRTKRDRNKKKHEELVVGDIRIKKRFTDQKSERTCPLCKTYSFSRRDDLYMNRFESCYDCYVDFIEYREKAWKDGQRPTDEHIEYALRRRK
jgi:hypothetical protein